MKWCLWISVQNYVNKDIGKIENIDDEDILASDEGLNNL